MRPLPRLRRHASESAEDTEPLAHLRRRFTFGAAVSAGVFAGAFVTDLVRHAPGDDMVVAGVERASLGIGVLCALAATMLWGLALNTENALSIWKVAARSARSEESLQNCGDASGNTARIPTQPIPISRGHEIRRGHHDRHAV